ncbi:hypothetical protein [Streptomyces sp. NBC_00391]|uniref:hypothetical protein n=1 Tax=Streptomyces sp. NBC_00391 TaxID=2903647 RepID=UPI002E1E1845
MPSPAVPRDQLLFNVVAGSGAPWRYRHDGALHGDLAPRLFAGHAARRRPRRCRLGSSPYQARTYAGS